MLAIHVEPVRARFITRIGCHDGWNFGGGVVASARPRGARVVSASVEWPCATSKAASAKRMMATPPRPRGARASLSAA